MNDDKTALTIRLIFGLSVMGSIALSLASAPVFAVLLALPLASAPVILYVWLFRTKTWSLLIGTLLLTTWWVMRLLPLSDDGLHGVSWFTIVPVGVLVAWAFEQAQVRRRSS